MKTNNPPSIAMPATTLFVFFIFIKLLLSFFDEWVLERFLCEKYLPVQHMIQLNPASHQEKSCTIRMRAGETCNESRLYVRHFEISLLA
ncbi:MAG TPA: hypothetical protein VH985_07125 [Candidatus Binatia bacterium]